MNKKIGKGLETPSDTLIQSQCTTLFNIHWYSGRYWVQVHSFFISDMYKYMKKMRISITVLGHLWQKFDFSIIKHIHPDCNILIVVIYVTYETGDESIKLIISKDRSINGCIWNHFSEAFHTNPVNVMFNVLQCSVIIQFVNHVFVENMCI